MYQNRIPSHGDTLGNKGIIPARLDAKQAADFLGFQEHDIPILINRGLLKPLGRPKPSARKYFATVGISALAVDSDWLDKATRIVSESWQKKNANRKKSCPDEITLVA